VRHVSKHEPISSSTGTLDKCIRFGLSGWLLGWLAVGVDGGDSSWCKLGAATVVRMNGRLVCEDVIHVFNEVGGCLTSPDYVCRNVCVCLLCVLFQKD
jgi:hypothetical protein